MRGRVAFLAALALAATDSGLASGDRPASPADPAPPGDPLPAPPDTLAAAARFELLLPRLLRGLDTARADVAFDPVARIEAEETAAVAEELLEEGEAGIAVELLERAIALLPPDSG